MVPERLDRQNFFEGTIDYPPPGEQNRPRINYPDIEKDLILLRPRKGREGNVTKEQSLNIFGRINDYVKVLNGKTDIFLAINIISRDNLNLGSILIQVPGEK